MKPYWLGDKEGLNWNSIKSDLTAILPLSSEYLLRVQ